MSYRDVLKGQIKRARKMEKRRELEAELELPPFPVELAYLWNAFQRLRRRATAGFGPGPWEWIALDAFCRRTGIRFAPWEIVVLEEIDDLYLASRDTTERSSSGPES